MAIGAGASSTGAASAPSSCGIPATESSIGRLPEPGRGRSLRAIELQEQLDRGDTPKPIIVKGPQPTISDCIQTFISGKQSEGISSRRVKKLRLQLDQFEAFMSARSKLFPSLITAADVIEFRAGWEKIWPSATTRQKAQQNIRTFLRTCCRENLNDLLSALKTIRLSKQDKERLEPKPFTEKEINALFVQIPKTFPAEKVALATHDTPLRNMARRPKSKSSRSRPVRFEKLVKLPADYFDGLHIGNVLFPTLYQFENGLRIVLDSYLTTCYGANWWDVSLKPRLQTVFDYADNQKKKLDAMPWMGASSVVAILPIHLVTLGHLEEVVKVYKSGCIPQLFPTMEFFLGHMEVIKRVRNMYSHMFPCITESDCQVAENEVRVLALHINSKLR